MIRPALLAAVVAAQLRKLASWFGVVALMTGALRVATRTLIAADHGAVGDALVTSALRVSRLEASNVPPERTGATIEARVDTETTETEVDERFLSVALDSSQLVGGHWWSPTAEVEGGRGRRRVAPFDFDRSRLVALASKLAPAYLRVGGTEADTLEYTVGPSSGDSQAGFELSLTDAEWSSLNRFASAAGFDLFFTINAGPATRDASGVWTTDNAERLLRVSRERGYAVAVWELGNELNGFWFHHGLSTQVSAATYQQDVARFRDLVKRYYPSSRVAGPGLFFDPVIGDPLPSRYDFLSAFLRSAGDGDIATWHFYPQQSRRCPVASRRASPTRLLEPSALDAVGRWGRYMERARDAVRPGAALWLTETGNAQCGGEPQVSDTMAGSLWWLDELGMMARLGQKVVVRQTLAGSNYGLLDDRTLEARPDYYASLLYKQLMGTKVLSVSSRGDNPYVRLYASCAAKASGASNGGFVLLAINLDADHPARVVWPEASGVETRRYAVTARSLTGREVELNGERLAPGDATSFEVPPGIASTSGEFLLAPASYAFVLASAGAKACSAASP